GIRDSSVTGVQTCALPISAIGNVLEVLSASEDGKVFSPPPTVVAIGQFAEEPIKRGEDPGTTVGSMIVPAATVVAAIIAATAAQIGRASCRERVWIADAAG